MPFEAHRPVKTLRCVAAAVRAICESNTKTRPEHIGKKKDEASPVGAGLQESDYSSHVIEEPSPQTLSQEVPATSERSESPALAALGANGQHISNSIMLSPAGLSADELAALRGDALVVATKTRDALVTDSVSPQYTPGHVPDSPRGVSFEVPTVPPLPKLQSSTGHSADLAGGSSLATPSSSRRAQSQASFGEVPDDVGDACIMPMHSSSPRVEAESKGQERPPASTTVLQQHHGSLPPGMMGFLGKGPFWTCDRGPIHSLRESQHGKKAPAACDDTPCLHSKQAGDAHSKGTALCESTLANCARGSPSSRAAHVVGTCIEVLVGAVNASADTAPPEDELTTVILDTREKRLHWREFLTEAVSQSSANSLYSAFDVGAEPPRYAKPPVSSATPFHHDGTKHVISPENTVPSAAPHGAGQINSQDQKKKLTWPASRMNNQAVPQSPAVKTFTPQSPAAKTSTPLGSPTACCSLGSETAAVLRHRDASAADAQMSRAPEGAMCHSRAGPAPAG